MDSILESSLLYSGIFSQHNSIRYHSFFWETMICFLVSAGALLLGSAVFKSCRIIFIVYIRSEDVGKDTMVSVQNVSMRFNLAQEQFSGLKDLAIMFTKANYIFMNFMRCKM